MGFIETAKTQWHRFVQRSAEADTPASGYWNKYFKAGGLYIKNSAGGVFALGGADATELTIASGAITRTQLYHKVDTEANAASDDLDTISGGVAGQHLYLRAEDAARTVILTHAIGNIRTGGLNSIALDETFKLAHLLFDGTNWNVVGYHAFPNDLADWGAAPDSDLHVAMQESGGQVYKIRGDYLRNFSTYPIAADIGASSQSLLHAIFDSTTSRTLTLSNVVDGHSIKSQALQIQIGTPHKILLPAGIYFGQTGTNRAALVTLTTDRLAAVCADCSGTLRFLTDIEVGITYASS